MKRLVFVLLIAASFASCKKDSGDTSGGSSSAVLSYFPTTVNNYWKFKDSASGTITTLTATGNKKTIDGFSYNVITSKNSTQTADGYVGLKNGYYVFLNLFSPSTTTVTGSLAFQILNDTLSVNKTWTYAAGTVNTFTAIGTGKVLAKGITKVVNGETYKDVIATQLSIAYSYMGVDLEAGRYVFYLAKGVGIIRVESSLDLIGSVYASNLIEYKIN